MRGKQKRYHEKCRKLADAERRKLGTEAPGGPKICALPECSNPTAINGRYCCSAHKQKAYRQRKARKSKNENQD